MCGRVEEFVYVCVWGGGVGEGSRGRGSVCELCKVRMVVISEIKLSSASTQTSLSTMHFSVPLCFPEKVKQMPIGRIIWKWYCVA